MDKGEFIELFENAPDEIDTDYIKRVISACLDRCHIQYPMYERGHMNLMSTMEECGELIEAISRRKRGRTEDNYELLEEMGDVILSILCVAEVFGITYNEIIRAINAKAERDELRSEQQKEEMLKKMEPGRYPHPGIIFTNYCSLRGLETGSTLYKLEQEFGIKDFDLLMPMVYDKYMRDKEEERDDEQD